MIEGNKRGVLVSPSNPQDATHLTLFADLGASDNQESGLDKEIVEAMRDKKSEELLNFPNFNWETFEAFLTREDIESIASGTRTDGDCSETEAISCLYESDNSMRRPPIIFSSRHCSGVESDTRVVIPSPCHPHISQNSQIPGFVEYAASWGDDWESSSDKGIGESNVEGRRDGKSVEQVLDWSRADWNWDYIEAYKTSGTSEMQGNKYREDIDSILSVGTNTDCCSDNEAVTLVYESDNTVQRPGFSFFENGEGIKRNSPEEIGSARKQYRSISGASRARNQHGCSFTGEGNTEEILNFAPEIILKEAVQHIGHNVADHREAQTSTIASIREEESGKIASCTYESLSQHFGRPLDDARKSFGVSRTAFKAMCRDVGIMRWKYGKRNMGRNSSETRGRINEEVPGKRNFSSGVPPVVVAHTSHNLKKIIVKATYNGAHIRFRLSDSSGKSELEENVIKRLHLERNTFTIKYQDDDGEWIIIACDEDVQECIEISRILKRTIIKMLIDRPVDYYAP